MQLTLGSTLVVAIRPATLSSLSVEPPVVSRLRRIEVPVVAILSSCQACMHRASPAVRLVPMPLVYRSVGPSVGLRLCIRRSVRAQRWDEGAVPPRIRRLSQLGNRWECTRTQLVHMPLHMLLVRPAAVALPRWCPWR